MTATYEFTAEEIETAFDRAGSACECCGKALTWSNSRSRGRGSRPMGSASRKPIYAGDLVLWRRRKLPSQLRP